MLTAVVTRFPARISPFRVLAALALAGLPVIGAAAIAPAAVEICDPALAGVPLNDNFVQPASTRQMIATIEKIYRAADPLKSPFRSSDQLPLLRAKMARAAGDPAEVRRLKLQYATHLLTAGRPAESLVAHDEVERFARANGLPVDDTLQNILLTGEALCHLRAGETANCLVNHNADSCLFPIRDGGVHQLQEGSRAAVATLTELLTKFPGDLRARWLLNIAYMTLGEYPDKVPPRWRIDPKVFASEYELPRFRDIGADLGLDLDGPAGGVVAEDFDRDGNLDLMVSAWGFTAKDQLRVFRNNGDGSFSERTKQAGLEGLVSGLNMIHADYNNDGFADVLVLRGGWLYTEGHYPFSLLRNNGDFTFTDVTVEAGMLHFKPTQTATWFDYNGDGWLDVFVGNESFGTDKVPCELYRNNRDGTFTECARELGLDVVAFVKGVTSGDYNNDGRPDLFLSTRGTAKLLFRNDGPAAGKDGWKFTEVGQAAGIDGPTNSFPCWFFDYDNDGWLDLFVAGYAIQDSGDVAADYLGRPTAAQRSKLYRNKGDGTFIDVSKAAGLSRVLLAMGANFGDLDNDGWLDFYLGTGDPDFATLVPSRMFRNNGGKRFQDVTTAGGFGQLQKGHAITFADFNNDGAQDIFSKVGGAVETDNYHSQFFHNPGFGNRWLKLQLEGVTTNRLAIGARIKVVVRDAGGERAIHRVVTSGGSFGANPLRQEIGLGTATSVEHVEIFWPVSGRTQVIGGLQLDHTYRVREDQPAAVALALRSFSYDREPGAKGGQHHHQHVAVLAPQKP
jgi:hypothetical protein